LKADIKEAESTLEIVNDISSVIDGAYTPVLEKNQGSLDRKLMI
jgi:hypothetical protein